MLKSSKDANKNMRSIQTIITDSSKRAEHIDHPKAIFTLDSDKQKNFKKDRENKNKKLLQARHKNPKPKHPNKKHTAKHAVKV